MKKWICYIWLLMLSHVGIWAQLNTDRVMMIGRNALYFEDYVLSIQYFNQVINAKSYLAEPYFYRGLAKLNLDDFQGAEEDCTESLKRNPFAVSAYQVRGLARIQQKNYAGAIEDYEKALKLAPENINIWHNLSLCRMNQEDYEGAKKDLDKLIVIAPRYTKAYLMRGEVDLKQNDTITARKDINKAIEIDRYDPDTWASRGMLQMMTKQYKDAEDDLTQAIYLSVRNAGLYINRALSRFYQNNLKGAMDDYDLALDIDPNHFIGHYNRGLLRAQVGDDNRAIEDFNFVIEMEPDNMMAIFNRGLLLDQTGDYRGAIKDYTTVIDEFPNFLIGYQYRAKARRRIGDNRGAEADEIVILKAQLDQQNGVQKQTAQADDKDSTRKKSDKNMNNYRKIVVADNDGMENQYKNEYRGRVQDRNINIIPQPMFILTYYEKINEVNQIVHYNKYIADLNAKRLYPNRLLITNEETPLSEKQVTRHFASIDEQTTAIVQHPQDVNKRFARSLDYYLVQDWENALADLNDAIECDSTFFPAYFNRAIIKYKQLEFLKVEQQEQERQSSEHQFMIMKAEYNLIKEDLDKVIELAPDFVHAYYNRANLLVTLKDYRSAIDEYDRVIEMDPKMADAYYNRGLTHIYLGNNKQGIQDLSKAGELGKYSAYNVIKRFTEVKE